MSETLFLIYNLLMIPCVSECVNTGAQIVFAFVPIGGTIYCFHYFLNIFYNFARNE